MLTVSRRSLLADNVNLRERNRRLEDHARGLEQRLSELLGTQISPHTGLGLPAGTAALREQADSLNQQILDLRRPSKSAKRKSPPRGTPTGG